MRTVKRTAFAYIAHDDRLLVFRHPSAPKAGIQVPAGTIEIGERPEDAAVREASRTAIDRYERALAVSRGDADGRFGG